MTMPELATDSDFSVAEREILEEELALHEQVKLAVRDVALAKTPDMSGLQTQLKELRDEAIHASERDLPALFQALYTHHSLANRSFKVLLPDMRAPYFGHMRLREGKKIRDVLIGYQSFIEGKSGVTIIDWRHAVLAKVFFNFREGDDYELELPGRLAHGDVLTRRLLTFEIGELVGVSGPGFSFTRERGGVWRKAGEQLLPKLAGGAGTAVNVEQFGVGANRRKLPDVSALLDREQYQILSRDEHATLLILGGAGCGKTTIALHRLALLAYRKPRFYQQKSMLVVVPEQGLVRLTQRLLRGLGMDDVNIATFDSWITAQGRKILKGIPKVIYESTPAQVSFIKRHPSMIAVVDKLVSIFAERIAARLRERLLDADAYAAQLLASQRRAPLAEVLRSLEERYCREVVQAGTSPEAVTWRKTTASKFFADEMQRLLNIEAVRSEIYTNPELHAVLLAEAGEAITPGMLKELVRHTRRQFEDPDGGASYKEAGKRAKAVDGVEVERDDYAGTLDIEDYAVLFLALQRLTGQIQRKGVGLTHYAHLVVDEAQDLAPVELRILAQALQDNSTVTVAGDAAQQSDPTVAFAGWDAVLAQLGVEAVEETRLKTNYRCPKPVAEFGYRILGPVAPSEPPQANKDGMPVMQSLFPNEGLAVVAMTEALRTLFDREPLATVAIVAANEDNARRIYDGLQNLDEVRLVIDGEFDFKPGIDVTDVAQVKGLEFDYVIIPDASARDYPDTPVARRALHIAVTRAVHQLWVISVGKSSEILANCRES